MKIKNFQDLIVWKKAHEMVLRIYSVTKFFPNEERFGLVTQIRRSAISICANISEGYMKSTNDFIRYMGISRGSLEETKYHLILSKDLSYIDEQTFSDLFTAADEVGKMLYKLKSSLKRF